MEPLQYDAINIITMGYYLFPPLFVFNVNMMLLSHCCKYWGYRHGFGGGGGRAFAFGVGWETEGVFGGGIAPIWT